MSRAALLAIEEDRVVTNKAEIYRLVGTEVEDKYSQGTQEMTN